ncbi:arylesterase [Cohaesibacter intestini]|uniref:arylesterase n=1 Tax=Cohaesibacter intestini TaxID=2211145 RepID=UPI0018E52EC6|nr:arylesterase [Cohaesibacter intestini]
MPKTPKDQRPQSQAATRDLTPLLRLAMAGSFLLLLLFVTLTRLHAAEPMRILAFGDSLSAGYQLPAGKGFTDQLQKSLTEQGLNVEVINAAVSGDTSANGLSRLDWSTPDGIDLVVLELGANDALQGLPVDKTKANLAAMIEKFRAKGAKVALMGMKAPPNMGQTYVSAFDAIYPALAEEMNVPLLPFFLEGVAGDPSLNLADGIHPNPQGIEIIVSNVAPFLLDIVKDLN